MIELIFGIIMLIICVILFIIADSYPILLLSQGGGAALYPKILIVLLFLMILYYLFQNRKKIEIVFKKKDQIEKGGSTSLINSLRGAKIWFLFMLVLLLLPLSLEYLGFMITSFWVILSSSIIIRWKENKLSWKGVGNSTLLSIIVSGVIYFIFVKLFVILLPTGKLF